MDDGSRRVARRSYPPTDWDDDWGQDGWYLPPSASGHDAPRDPPSWPPADALADAPTRPYPTPGRYHHPTTRRARSGGRRPFWRRPHVVLVLVALLACVVASLAGIITIAPVFTHARSLASDGVAHLKNAETELKALSKNPFDTTSIASARKELASANSDFTQLSHVIGGVPGVAGAIPHYGALYDAGAHLAPVAIELTQAGMLGCDALSLVAARLKNPLDASSTGLTPDDAKTLQADLTRIVTLADTAVAQVRQVPAGDLTADPRLGPTMALFQQNLPSIQTALGNVRALIPLLPALLGVGTPATFLIEQLDSTEIRAGGGFIGTYGLATLDGGRLTSLHMTDVDLLDYYYKYGPGVIPIPPQYSWFVEFPRWGFRDSNLDADFPTSARNGEQLYQTETNATSNPFQGVVAITPWLFQNALKITGPISVPEYNETITADNFVERIHYYQLINTAGPDYVSDPGSGTSLRKRFTGYLFDHFMAQIKSLAGTPKMGDLLHLLVDSLQTKDLQIYLNAAPAESLLRQAHLASTIEAPPTGDSLLIVHDNVIGDKANSAMTYVLDDQVTLDAQGNALHTATLTYTWPASGYCDQSNYCFGITDYYAEHVRIYVPPTAKLASQSGWLESGTAQAFGRAVFSGDVRVPYGGTTTVSLSWTVPHAAVRTATEWHYQYLLQRQAGIAWTTAVRTTLPACAKVAGTPSQLRFVGSHGTMASVTLTRDTTMSVDYGC